MATRAFSSADVVKLLGITPVYLNALVHRELYGIKASISERSEGKLRIFSEEDVFGIALVWMLFEAGLRTQSIREILLQLVHSDNANAAAEYLMRPGSAHLVIVRESGKTTKKTRAKLRVEAVLTEDLMESIEEFVDKYPSANILLVPAGARFVEVEKKIAAMYGD